MLIQSLLVLVFTYFRNFLESKYKYNLFVDLEFDKHIYKSAFSKDLLMLYKDFCCIFTYFRNFVESKFHMTFNN